MHLTQVLTTAVSRRDAAERHSPRNLPREHDPRDTVVGLGLAGPFLSDGIRLRRRSGTRCPRAGPRGGEWRGDAKVGPKYGCCSGQGGPVRLSLEQDGSVVRGVIEGTGWRGTVDASVKGAKIWGSCRCTTSQHETNMPFEASVSGAEMVMRISDATMILNRTP